MLIQYNLNPTLCAGAGVVTCSSFFPPLVVKGLNSYAYVRFPAVALTALVVKGLIPHAFVGFPVVV